MAIVLHRFPLSHFSEKGRALLDFKKLDYEIREYRLGFSQLRIKKLSGQRQVPVIEHDGNVVSDSTRIAHYLDEKFPDRRALFPKDEATRKDVVDLENRIDRVLGVGPALVWGEYALEHKDHLELLAIEIDGGTKVGMRVLGAGVRIARKLGAGQAFVDKHVSRTRVLLQELVGRLARTPYLCGSEPTVADVAAAGLVFHMEFPKSRHFVAPELAGKEHGVKAWTEDPAYAPFFEWRRGFYASYLT